MTGRLRTYLWSTYGVPMYACLPPLPLHPICVAILFVCSRSHVYLFVPRAIDIPTLLSSTLLCHIVPLCTPTQDEYTRSGPPGIFPA